MILVLALKDLRHQRTMFLCYALALASVLAPLMVVFSVKTGVVSHLTDALLGDPSNREVAPLGHRSVDADWLETLAVDPTVGFVVPRTRALSATVGLRPEGDSRAAPISVDAIPTAPGDPLLDAAGLAAPEGDRLVLTADAAASLGVAAGDRLDGVVERQLDGRRQHARLVLEVVGVLPRDLVQRRAALVPLDLLVALEDYRDGYAVPDRGWDGAQDARTQRVFAAVRLYAVDLESVAPLVERLAAQGIETRSRLADIAAVRTLDRGLGGLFALIAGLAGAGYLASLGFNLWAGVERKRRDLSVIRLLGISRREVLLFPMLQAVAIALAGMAAAAVVYLATAAVMNRALLEDLFFAGMRAHLEPLDVALGAAATLLGVLAVSAAAGWRAARSDPAEGLREE